MSDDSGRYKLGVLWHYAGDMASAGRPAPPHPAPQLLINGNKLIARTPDAEVARPASMHGDYVNAALADGSVATLCVGMDYHAYQALMTPNTADSDMPNLDYPLHDDD